MGYYQYNNTKARDQLVITKKESFNIPTMKNNTATEKKTEDNTTLEDLERLSAEDKAEVVDCSLSAIAALQNGKKLCCKNSEELNSKLSDEKASLENRLRQLTKFHGEKEL